MLVALGLGLATGEAIFRPLDAVHDGVTQHVLERRQHALEHLPVELALDAFRCRHVDRGRRAYLAKDFEQAAVHFENAYRDAPRAETLRLAIRARRDAKQLARAATLAAIAQQRYPDDAALEADAAWDACVITEPTGFQVVFISANYPSAGGSCPAAGARSNPSG